jgi:hypothetical protein
MDAKAVAQAAGVAVGTLNVWVQRDLIPGMQPGARGRLRDFDVKTATHIAIMAELARLGIGAPTAATIASDHDRGLRVALMFDVPIPPGNVPPDDPLFDKLKVEFKRNPGRYWFSALDDLKELFATVGEPAVYLIVNVEAITTRMRQAEAEWQDRQKRSE